ncbi:MAG: D-alanyl-D-alanine carboxypeptidase/D-alanyl-D-alanine-endopeptidase [Betaproteobacteria bacterium]|nr:D-alanyl-D-alanine carboxypeptidase/D-alanyl-D-alanine-endopeptidase [Betaproteobacteria bacterium]
MNLLHRAFRPLALAAAVFAAAALPGFATGAEGGLPAPVAQALKQAGIPEAAVAVYVQEVEARAPLVAVNADRSMNPASVMKLLTTYAGLEILGPAFTWGTEVYAGGALEPDRATLRGDLILKGYGDPKLSLENFWLLLRRLREAGLRHISGDLVLDGQYFAAANGDPGAFDNRPLRAYNAGPEALMVNARVVNFRFVPDPAENRVRVTADPVPAGLQLLNQLALSSGPCNDWRAALDWDAKVAADQASVAFRGSYAAECGEKALPLVLFENQRYVHGLFKDLWTGLGGTLQGGVRQGATPPGAQLLYRHSSPPLADVVRDINKFSNNVMARQLYLTLGAAANGEPATSAKSLAAVKGWLAAKRMEFPELVLENGSGLSRIERLSARHLGELLAAAYASPVMPEFMASLPIIALDGTMKSRLRDSAAAGRGHIKTGLLDGVKTLGGYVLDSRGRRIVIVFLINHPKAVQAQAAMDALLQWVYGPPAAGKCCARR